MRIMKFEIWSKYLVLRESVKDDELNKILDKISKSSELTKREKEFLSKYDSIVDSDMKDLSFLSMDSTFYKIQDLLSSDKKVICNLFDRDGQINDEIISIEKDYDKDTCLITCKHGDTTILSDRFLYNIRYQFSDDSYYLEAQDEFFEKIPVKDEEY